MDYRFHKVTLYSLFSKYSVLKRLSMPYLKNLPSFVATLTIVLCTRCQADIIVDAYTHATNDRFSNNPNFIASAFNLSGIGQSAGGFWATAISNNVVISASHLFPSGTVYFYPGNDPSVAPVTRQITSSQIIGQTDIWVAVLDHPLPASIATYPIANHTLSTTPSTMTTLNVASAGPYQGLNAYLFGISPFNTTIVGDDRFDYNDQAVGRNLISGYAENVPITNLDNDSIVMYWDQSPSPDFVMHEAFFQSGDSGGPTFVDVSGQLVLLGTNLFAGTATINDVSTGVSGISYLGNRASEIQSFIQMNAVPEPTSIALISIFGTTMILRSRRRN
jgi:hypothetical protein